MNSGFLDSNCICTQIKHWIIGIQHACVYAAQQIKVLHLTSYYIKLWVPPLLTMIADHITTINLLSVEDSLCRQSCLALEFLWILVNHFAGVDRGGADWYNCLLAEVDRSKWMLFWNRWWNDVSISFSYSWQTALIQYTDTGWSWKRRVSWKPTIAWSHVGYRKAILIKMRVLKSEIRYSQMLEY